LKGELFEVGLKRRTVAIPIVKVMIMVFFADFLFVRMKVAVNPAMMAKGKPMEPAEMKAAIIKSIARSFCFLSVFKSRYELESAINGAV